MRTPPFIMTCTIQKASTSVDAFGQPTGSGASAAGTKCYWWGSGQGRLVQTGAPGVVATDTEHILFARGTDVKPGDRITTVSDHTGSVVFTSQDFRVVEHVVVHRNHLDCTLRYGIPVGGRT